jgi:hypothetical protein
MLGGTNVAINGRFLDVGSFATVTIGGSQCHVLKYQSLVSVLLDES